MSASWPFPASLLSCSLLSCFCEVDPQAPRLSERWRAAPLLARVYWARLSKNLQLHRHRGSFGDGLGGPGQVQGSPSCLSALTGKVPFYHGGPGTGLILVWEVDSL